MFRKKIAPIVTAILFGITACNNYEPSFEIVQQDEWLEYPGETIPYSENFLNREGDPLKILWIGNSYGLNATEYIPALLEANGIDNVTFGRLYKGGCPLKTHLEGLEKGTSIYETYEIIDNNTWVKQPVKNLEATLRECDWNIVVLQDFSGNYFNPAAQLSYSSQLENRITAILGQTPIFIWFTSWAYSQGYKGSAFATYNYNEQTMFNTHQKAVHDYLLPSGLFDFVLATHVLMQNARNTSYNNALHFTDDGSHADKDAGRALLALYFYETVIRKLTSEAPVSTHSIFVDTGSIPFTEKTQPELLEALNAAIEHPFELFNVASGY